MTGKGFLIALLMAAACVLAKSLEVTEKDVGSDEDLWNLYEKWRSHHTVSRDLTEKQKRYNVFKANALHVYNSNKMDKPYKLKLNKFADMTSHEFRNYYSSKVKHFRMLHGTRAETGFMHEEARNLPTSVDWRKQGAVTGVKNQGRCGKKFKPVFPSFHLDMIVRVLNWLNSSKKKKKKTGSCWAFSTVVGVEGINKIKTGQLISLSEQELVDCESDNEGCNGGLMENAYEFIKKKGGITTERAYPYRARNELCDSKKVSLIHHTSVYVYICIVSV